MIARNKSTRLSLMQFAPPALRTTRKSTEPISKGLTVRKSETPHRRKSLVFSIVHSRMEARLVRPQEVTVSLSEPLDFPMDPPAKLLRPS